MTAAFQPPRTAPARPAGSRFFAPPPRAPRHRHSRPANRRADRKTAPGIFLAPAPKTHRETPSQSLGTYQESTTYVFVFASGCAVAPNSVANNLGASNFPYSGPSPDGCAIGVLQNLYAADGAQVPSVQTIQNAVANYWSKIDPGDPSNPTASQVGVTSGVFFGTLSGAVNGSLSSYGYTATQQNFNTSDPATLQTLVTTYGAVGITITVTLPDGTTANHAVMYNGQNMYTAYPTTATGNATAIPTSPAQMAGMANSSFVLVLVPIKPH